MGKTFGEILATILVELLRYVQSREDLKALVRTKILAAGLQSANDALGWKATAMGDIDGGSTLRVQDGAVPITISGGSSSVGGSATSSTVQPRPDGNPVPPPA